MRHASQRVSYQVVAPKSVAGARCPAIQEDLAYVIANHTGEYLKPAKAAQWLAAQLLRAQEAERRRIARDLHDVIDQRLAILAMDLGRLAKDVDTNPALQKQLKQLRDQAEEITREVRSLSHQLHSAALEHLGLVSALRSYCREFQELEGIPVAFDVGRGVMPANAEVSLCLYRIAQEALRNVAKHAEAKHVLMRLNRSARHLLLEITDDGRGFDVVAARFSSGIGIASMEERARLAAADFQVSSERGKGTVIAVRVRAVTH